MRDSLKELSDLQCELFRYLWHCGFESEHNILKQPHVSDLRASNISKHVQQLRIILYILRCDAALRQCLLSVLHESFGSYLNDTYHILFVPRFNSLHKLPGIVSEIIENVLNPENESLLWSVLFSPGCNVLSDQFILDLIESAGSVKCYSALYSVFEFMRRNKRNYLLDVKNPPWPYSDPYLRLRDLPDHVIRMEGSTHVFCAMISYNMHLPEFFTFEKPAKLTDNDVKAGFPLGLYQAKASIEEFYSEHRAVATTEAWSLALKVHSSNTLKSLWGYSRLLRMRGVYTCRDMITTNDDQYVSMSNRLFGFFLKVGCTSFARRIEGFCRQVSDADPQVSRVTRGINVFIQPRKTFEMIWMYSRLQRLQRYSNSHLRRIRECAPASVSLENEADHGLRGICRFFSSLATPFYARYTIQFCRQERSANPKLGCIPHINQHIISKAKPRLELSLLVQTLARGVHARSKFNKIKAQAKAAVAIQRVVRGGLVRYPLRKVKDAQAAVAIQRFFRRGLMRYSLRQEILCKNLLLSTAAFTALPVASAIGCTIWQALSHAGLPVAIVATVLLLLSVVVMSILSGAAKVHHSKAKRLANMTFMPVRRSDTNSSNELSQSQPDSQS